MIAAAKICGVDIRQEKQTPEIIISHGLHLALFTEYFLNNVSIYKDDVMEQNKRYHHHLYLHIQWSTRYTFRS